MFTRPRRIFYLAKLKQGETIVLRKRNRPIAEIRPIPSLPDAPRSVGLAKDIFEVPARFFEPLPQSIIEDFDGARSITRTPSTEC